MSKSIPTPNDQEVKELIALYKAKDFNKLKNKADAILEKNKEHHIALNILGLSFTAQGDIEKALRSFDESIKIKPDYAVAYNNKANIFLKKKEYDEAIILFKKAYNFDPTTKIKFNLANCYFKKEEFDEAIQIYEEIIDADEKLLEAHKNLGLSYQAKEKYDEALKVFERILIIDSHNIDAKFNLGNIYLAKNNYEEANNIFNELIEASIDPRFHYNNGVAYQYRKEYELAIDEYKKTTKLDTNNLKALHNIAVCYKGIDDDENALKYLKKCQSKDPQSEEANENLANFYLSLSDYSNAIKHYKKILEINPKNLESLSNLGISYLMSNKLDEALEEFQTAHSINADSFELMRLIGEIYYRKNETEKAIPFFEKSIDIEPIDGADRAHYYLGKLYEKNKNYEKSLFHYRESEIFEENSYWKEDYLNILLILENDKKYKLEFEKIYHELEDEGNQSEIFIRAKEYFLNKKV
tara:strand:- start:675 stop:2081 length:1407 start_codon:yes stop_codon:yes gene_type:complete